jgi:type II secretion system protein J
MELLVATAVGAIVLLAVQTVFFGALRLTNTTRERTDRELRLQRTLDIVRRDLSGVMLPGGPLGGQLVTSLESSMTDIAGDRISPDFYTTSGRIDGWNPFSEVQAVSYYLALGTGDHTSRDLVRVVMRNLLPAATVTTADYETQVLLEGVEEAAFEFFDGTNWTSEWDSTGGDLSLGLGTSSTTSNTANTAVLPKAIRFLLVLSTPNKNQNQVEPIELLVPVLVKTVATQAQEAEEEMP